MPGILYILFTLQVVFHTNTVTGKHKTSNGPIIFPGPIKEVNFLTRYGSDNSVPDECKDKTYCTVKPADYPESKFSAMFKSKVRSRRDLNLQPQNNGNSELPTGTPEIQPSNGAADIKPVADVSDLGDRQGDPDEIDNCETQISFDPLYRVRQNISAQWRDVVQAPDKNYVQSVRLEICKETKSECFTRFAKPPSYTTFCKQKYSTWKVVVALEEGSGKTETISVDLPTCCSCHYKFN